MGIIQEKRTVLSSQPEKREERTLDSIRYDKKDVPVENEKQEEEPEKVEEPEVEAEAAVVEDEPAAVEEKTQPRKKGGRPRKSTNKKK